MYLEPATEPPFGAHPIAVALAAGSAIVLVLMLVFASPVNGLTRARILDVLSSIKSFDANGWMGEKDPRGMSNCYVMTQLKAGKFVRTIIDRPADPAKPDLFPFFKYLIDSAQTRGDWDGALKLVV